LNNQLETYIFDIRSGEVFIILKGIEQLAENMTEMKKKLGIKLLGIYSLVTLAGIDSASCSNYC
jgi:hypothetical protein